MRRSLFVTGDLPRWYVMATTSHPNRLWQFVGVGGPTMADLFGMYESNPGMCSYIYIACVGRGWEIICDGRQRTGCGSLWASASFFLT